MKPPKDCMLINKNKRAYFEYEILDKYVGGIKLTGPEVKSVRASNVSISEAYCRITNDELFILGLHIAPYNQASDYNPTQERKLLLHKKEILKLKKNSEAKGLTIVPLSVFINNHGYIKIDVGVGRGKKEFQKKQTIIEREAKRAIKNY